VAGGPQLWGLSYTYTDGTEAGTGSGTQPPGLLKTRTDALGRVTAYAYDAAGDLVQTTGPTGVYDFAGNVTAVARRDGASGRVETTSYTYNAGDALTSETVENGSDDLTTTYERAGWRPSCALADGSVRCGLTSVAEDR